MKTLKGTMLLAMIAGAISCGQQNDKASAGAQTEAESHNVGQSGVQDDVSNPNIVQVAVGSKDHSTLVAAIKAAGLVDALSNAGPFTVFAPVNAAFDKLPAGTVEKLLEPANKDDLSDILEYHVSLGVYKQEALTDGRILGQVNGGNISIVHKDGVPTVNGKAHILASVPSSNGVIHIIDEVLLPQ